MGGRLPRAGRLSGAGRARRRPGDAGSSAALGPARHIQLVIWNLGNAAVLVGTLLGATPLVDAGGLALVVGLALTPDRHGVYFVDDATNTLDLLY